MMNENDIEKRNMYLAKFFAHLTLMLELNDEIKIIGSSDNPAVVVNNEKIMNCFVKNFDLHFTDANWRGDIIFSIKLKESYFLNFKTIRQIQEWMVKDNHKKAFKVKLKNTALFLTGFQSDTDLLKTLKPVFSEVNPKIYFNESNANETIEKYSNEKTKLELV